MKFFLPFIYLFALVFIFIGGQIGRLIIPNTYLLSAVGDSPELAPSIKFVKPSPGVIWVTGIDKTITWTTANISPSATIFLRLYTEDGQYIPEVNNGLPLSAGTNDGTQTVVFSPKLSYGQYYLELDTSSVNGVNVPATRVGPFYISPPKFISFREPLEGAIWPINSGQNVSWFASLPTSDPLKLERLDVNNKVMETIIDTPNDGNYLVPIVAGPAGEYRYRLTSTLGVDDTVVTSGLFKIVPAQTTYWLKIDSPVADEIWPAGGPAQTVRWSSNLPEFEKFKLERIKINNNKVVATNADLANSGFFTVTIIPNTPGKYRYKLSSTLRPDPTAESEIFEIGKLPNSLPYAITIPPQFDLTGKQYVTGSLINLKWTTSANIPQSADLPTTSLPRMIVRLFKSDGTAVVPGISPIIQGGNDGEQSVTLPSSAVPGDYYLGLVTTPIGGAGGVDVPVVKTGIFTVISAVSGSNSVNQTVVAQNQNQVIATSTEPEIIPTPPETLPPLPTWVYLWLTTIVLILIAIIIVIFRNPLNPPYPKGEKIRNPPLG
ncbi:MAG: hypothetical protein AAB453_01825 [Patescibacteria group bacterium]